MNKKLNLQWISDVIMDDHEKWELGDTVTIDSQTNTGKTTYILNQLNNNLKHNEKMIYICNRKELKRQIKIELLRKFNMDIPETTEELDSIKTIGNITIESYQSIGEKINFLNYNNAEYKIEKFKYIVQDECHFYYADSQFNNKTFIIFNKLIREHYSNSIKILISATMDEMLPVFKRFISGNLHQYSTGRDYSYLNPKYFKEINNIINLIKNDSTKDKWIVFVANKKTGEKIKKELLKYKITCSFITSDSNQKERKNISINNKFNCKVLITTKCLDNGVSIHDAAVKHIVITAYDKLTFLQEIGRIRIDIKNARPINLYIDIITKKNFYSLLNVANVKHEIVKMFSNDYDEFVFKHDHNTNKVPQELFHLSNSKDRKWELNLLAHSRLYSDIRFYEEVIEEYYNYGEFAYCYMQLKWLGLEEQFDESNLIENVTINDEVDSLNQFLKEAFENDIRFDKDEFINSIEEIIKSKLGSSLDDVLTKLDSGNKRDRGMKQYNKLFQLLEFPFMVSSKKFKVNGKIKTKWIVSKM